MLGLLAAFAFLLYRATLDNMFLSDDFGLLLLVKEGGPFGLWARPGYDGLFRPIISLTWYADYRIWGLNPLGFHLTNLIGHILNAFLIVVLLDKLLEHFKLEALRGRGAGLLAGALFVAMPAHAESVSWVSGRTDVIAGVFLLASLIFYLEARQRGAWVWALSVAAFAVGLLAKEIALSFPLLIVALEGLDLLRAGFSRKAIRRAFLACLPYFVVLILYVPLKLAVMGELVGVYGSFRAPPNPQNWLIGAAHSFTRIWLPYNQWMASLSGTLELNALLYCTAGGVILILIGLAAWQSRRLGNRQPFYLMLWLLVGCGAMILPLISLFSWPTIGYIPENDRLVYIASMFLAMAFALAAFYLLQKRWTVWVLGLLILIFWSRSLLYLNQNWATASHITASIIDSLKTDPPGGRFLVVNLPDNYNSAYIFRNDLGAATTLYVPGAPLPDAILSFFQSPEATVVFPIKLAVRGGFTLSGPVHFYSHEYNLQPGQRTIGEHYEIYDYQGDQFSFIIKPTDIPLYYYSEGRLIRLPIYTSGLSEPLVKLWTSPRRGL